MPFLLLCLENPPAGRVTRHTSMNEARPECTAAKTPKFGSSVAFAMSFSSFLLREGCLGMLSGWSDSETKERHNRTLCIPKNQESFPRRWSVAWTGACETFSDPGDSQIAPASLILLHLLCSGVRVCFLGRISLPGLMFCRTRMRRWMPASDNHEVLFCKLLRQCFTSPVMTAQRQSESEGWSPSLRCQAVMLR